MWVMWRSVAVVLSAVGCGSAFVLGEEVVQGGTRIGLQNMVGGRYS